MTRTTHTGLALLMAASTLVLAGAAEAQQQQREARVQNQEARQVQGRERQARRQDQRQVRGTIRDIRRVTIDGIDGRTTLVLLENRDGRRMVVDLGSGRLPVRLATGQSLSVRGRVVQLGDQRYVLRAEALRYDGRSISRNSGRTEDARSRQTRRGEQGSHDANGNAAMGPRELEQALYDMFDGNDDGVLTVGEWDRGIDRSFGESTVDLDVTRWDRNGNGRIARNEFRSGLRQSGLFSSLDAGRSGEIELREAPRRTGYGYMDRERFGRQMSESNVRAGFDTDGNDRVSYQEYAAGLYSTWDLDDDNRLSEQEYERSSGWFGDEYASFDAWDDGDSWLSESEFFEGLQRMDVFSEFDADGNGWFDDNELYDAAYAGWDRDDDGMLNEREWREARSTYEDDGLF